MGCVCDWQGVPFWGALRYGVVRKLLAAGVHLRPVVITDWAAQHRTANPDIPKGQCIVCGTNEGLHATVSRSEDGFLTMVRTCGFTSCWRFARGCLCPDE